MSTLITNPQDYTIDDLKNNDWDMIRLNITFDPEPLLEWFREVNASHPESLFLFSMKHLFKSHLLDQPRMNGISVGDSGFWTLQWPVQRTDPIPGPFFCDTTRFPELLKNDWHKDMNKHLNHYYFGAYKKFIAELGEDAWTWGRAMSCGNECGIGPHRDTDEPSYMIRLHVNLQTNDQSTWHFGTELADSPAESWKFMNRKYIPKAGEMYLVNVSNVHSPINHGNEDWILLHSDPLPSAINRLLKTEKIINFN